MSKQYISPKITLYSIQQESLMVGSYDDVADSKQYIYSEDEEFSNEDDWNEKFPRKTE